MSDLCSKGCGFYANPEGMGMCSKCHREHAKEMAQKAALEEEKELAAKEEKEEKKKSSTRCFQCNKKVGLLGFRCRCDQLFCGIHRHAEDHKCTFDYKKQGREAIAKANPKIVPYKVDRI